MDELLGDFLTETGESLDLIDRELVRFEQEPNNAEMLNAIFRLMHTVKGTCGFLGLPRLAKLAHAAETLMGQYRDGTQVTVEGVSLILDSIDRIKSILAELEREGAEPSGSDGDLIAALEGLAETNEQGPASAVPRFLSEAAAVTPEKPASAKAEVPRREQTVRVNVDTLEHLMTTVSELVLTRNQLLEIVRKTGENSFKAPLQRLSNVTAELQDGIMKARLQPIAKAWQKLPRLVRELSLELGKKIEIEMQGGETELDRQVLELIKDPLTHMIRNSADHGIEGAAERAAAGKRETGRITLSAQQRGGYIVIEIGDDGRGLDARKVRDKALAAGLASQADLERLSEAEIYKFIFKAGLSTAETVTGVSGRGVGMDVVRSNIETIGGSVELQSTSPQGTVFAIKIPLTLAIMPALIVEAGGQRFAVPQFAVIELVRSGRGSEHRIETINATKLFRLRDRLLPLLDLAELLHLDAPDNDAPGTRMATVVVMQIGARRFGLVVDSVFHAEEIVVKPLASLLRQVGVFSGNTILGDGAVIMIVDPNALAGLIGTVEADEASPESADAAAASGKMPLLLFRAGSATPKAVPLSAITRLEEIDRASVERCNGRDVVQYRGRLMPLVYVGGEERRAEGALQPVLVLTSSGHAVGLAVDAILDIVEDRVEIEMAGVEPGIVGSAVVAGKAAEIVDVSHYLAKGIGKRLPGEDCGEASPKLLLVDDSQFFRDMLGPLLVANGFDVTLASSASEALRLKEQGRSFDAILCDLDMPEIDGFAFAQILQRDPAWSEVPLIALSAEHDPLLVERARECGFSFHAGKFDREVLLAMLNGTFKRWGRAA